MSSSISNFQQAQSQLNSDVSADGTSKEKIASDFQNCQKQFNSLSSSDQSKVGDEYTSDENIERALGTGTPGGNVSIWGQSVTASGMGGYDQGQAETSLTSASEKDGQQFSTTPGSQHAGGAESGENDSVQQDPDHTTKSDSGNTNSIQEDPDHTQGPIFPQEDQAFQATESAMEAQEQPHSKADLESEITSEQASGGFASQVQLQQLSQ